MKNRGWLIVLLISVSVVAVMLGGYATRASLEPWFNADKQFVKEKAAPAARAYDRIMKMDLEINYPSSPEGVMDFFNETFYLMYSKSILDDGTLLEVMIRQRDVYSEELRDADLNRIELQFAKLKSDLESLYEENNICLSVERKGTVYDDKSPGECVVQTMIYYNTVGAIYRNYFLVQDKKGRWRVNGWLDTDENYSIDASSSHSV